jgi:hypothetical protein
MFHPKTESGITEISGGRMHRVGRLLVLLPLCSFLLLTPSGRAQSHGTTANQAPRIAHENTSEQEQTRTAEIAQLKTDIQNLQSLLNQMQANFSLVGNPTMPANHILQLQMEMWHIVTNQMQRHLSRIEDENQGRSQLQK